VLAHRSQHELGKVLQRDQSLEVQSKPIFEPLASEPSSPTIPVIQQGDMADGNRQERMVQEASTASESAVEATSFEIDKVGQRIVSV
jgi:hypothetical protein